jgi:transposase
MSMSELTLKSSAEGAARRLEVFTGAGRRREWSAEDKARIVADSFEPGATVSGVARRHGLTPQQLFTWRREAREAAQGLPVFVPAVIDPEPRVEPSAEPPRRHRGRPKKARTTIEVEAFGVTVRIAEGAAPAMIAAVIGALKAQR